MEMPHPAPQAAGIIRRVLPLHKGHHHIAHAAKGRMVQALQQCGIGSQVGTGVRLPGGQVLHHQGMTQTLCRVCQAEQTALQAPRPLLEREAAAVSQGNECILQWQLRPGWQPPGTPCCPPTAAGCPAYSCRGRRCAPGYRPSPAPQSAGSAHGPPLHHQKADPGQTRGATRPRARYNHIRNGRRLQTHFPVRRADIHR